MLVTAARLRANPPAAGRLTLLFSADEEDGASFGAHHLASGDTLEGIDGIVIGEPGGIDDDYDRLHLVSRGIARLHVVAAGQQGHSSLSDEHGTAEDNAGVAAARAVVAIADRLRVAIPDNAHDLLGWRATVNTGLSFRGGVGYGVLPGRMSVDTEVRLLPGMDREHLLAAVGQVVQPIAVEFDAPPNDWLPATMVEPDGALAGAARAACADVLGAAPRESVFPGTTDAAWFHGLAGIPTLPALGPGLIRRAHGADEWVSVAAVRTAVDLYEALARRFCARSDEIGQRVPERVEATA
jgi:acetylornithine deacetylase/succinyl-diaminopimelate desuccinylase-like protein